eukprot:TRINITY_DN7383_c0_g1_i1.p1 TRINITY_DN7383_c0_g1~~TRINITY_DN7383_c0_g1_i1.p1  ORF type:complete len:548 (+),score=121.82 TRINITY_DN7383_c0_g1_i1:53-1696(+)
MEEDGDNWVMMEGDKGTLRAREEDFVVVSQPTPSTKGEKVTPGTLDTSQLDTIVSSKPYLPNLLEEEWKKSLLSAHATSRVSKRKTWSRITAIPPSRKLVRQQFKMLIRKGIPNKLRSLVWAQLLEIPNNATSRYITILNTVFGERVPARILKPPLLGRDSLPLDQHFLSPVGGECLKRILCCVAMEYPAMTFAPHVAHLISIFLKYFSEAETYFAIAFLMEDTTGLYFPLSPSSATQVAVTFGVVLKSSIPKLDSKMKEFGVSSEDFSDWFSSLLFDVLPYQTALRVLDAVLSEGIKVLYRVAYALFKKMKGALLTQCQGRANFLALVEQLTLQSFDEGALMKTAFGLNVSRSSLGTSTKLDLSPDPDAPVYYRPKVSEPPKLFLEEDLEVMYEWLPTRLRIRDLSKVFDASLSGYSFTTFSVVMAELDESLVVFSTSDGGVVGLFVNVPWRQSPGFIGTSECFVFQLGDDLKAYHWVDEKENAETNFLHLENNGFRFGMSRTGTALSVNEDWFLTSQGCSMFDSPPLVKGSEPAEIVTIEVFIFE